jgi:CDP-diglyceride synthetase
MGDKENLLHWLFSIWSFFYGFAFTVIVIKKALAGDTKHILNEILIIILFFIAAILYPFVFIKSSINIETQQVLFLISGIIVNLEMSILYFQIFSSYLRCKKDPVFKNENSWDSYVKACLDKEKIEKQNEPHHKITSTDLSRKALHLIPPTIIISIILISFFLDNIGILPLWGLDVQGFSLWIIFSLGMAFVFMFSTGDLFRLAGHYEMLPIWGRKWFSSAMTREEWGTLTGTIPIALALVPFLFTDLPVLISVTLIATVADASAALVGKLIGRIKLSKNSKYIPNKTVEGHIAGGIVTFGVVFLTAFIFQVDFIKNIVMSGVATALFLFVDRYTRNLISDNILNPVICGLGIIIVYSIF